jgi:hypothetical protein
MANDGYIKLLSYCVITSVNNCNRLKDHHETRSLGSFPFGILSYFKLTLTISPVTAKFNEDFDGS